MKIMMKSASGSDYPTKRHSRSFMDMRLAEVACLGLRLRKSCSRFCLVDAGFIGFPEHW